MSKILSSRLFEYEVSPDLVALAERWPTYIGTTSWTNYGRTLTADMTRCADCDGIIYGTVLQHLTQEHGYRMDGKRYGNDNTVLGEARDAYR